MPVRWAKLNIFPTLFSYTSSDSNAKTTCELWMYTGYQTTDHYSLLPFRNRTTGWVKHVWCIVVLSATYCCLSAVRHPHDEYIVEPCTLPRYQNNKPTVNVWTVVIRTISTCTFIWPLVRSLLCALSTFISIIIIN